MGGLALRRSDPGAVQSLYEQAVGIASGGGSGVTDYPRGSYQQNLPGPDVGQRADHARQVVAGDRLYDPRPVPALGTRAFDHHLATIDHRHGRELELDESSYNEGFVAGLRKGKSAAKYRSGQSVEAAAKQGMDRRSKRKSKPSMKQKQLKASVGKRTANQPPPNCKVSKHLHFKSDSDDDKTKIGSRASV